MDIIWHGHSCFRLRAGGTTVLTDPYHKGNGFTQLRLKADLLTISHDHAGHNNTEVAKGSDPFVITGPGEYEVGGVFVIGVTTHHDARGGGNLGPNTAYNILLEDISVCHLGDLGHRPTQAQVEALGDIDVLLIPIGGHNTIGPSEAAEVVNLLDPSIVIPMHYHSAGRPDLEPVERFLQVMGVEAHQVQESFKVARNRLPDEVEVVVLEPKLG